MLSRVHLDTLGGIAGDMFVAAIADAFPDVANAVLVEVAKLSWPKGASVKFVEHRGGALRGKRFDVAEPHAHGHGHGHDHGHHHTGWRDIRAMLEQSALAAGTKRHALAIFAVLAEAEGRVHGIPAEEVGFHEVGAWDSIVDIVAAGCAIDRLSPARWTWSALPMGGGRVKTQHGLLPVPAPATALLLKGMELVDDGIPGERVTPTGAAILRHLADLGGEAGKGAECLVATGIGFGTREMEDLPNIVRCMAYEVAAGAAREDVIATLEFEVDDQSPEDLGIAIERLRAMDGVLEVYQSPVFAKKNRIATHVRVLARRDAADAVADACFEQTTTLGLRIAEARRRVLAREERKAGGVRVKVAERPSGAETAKAESDDVAAQAANRAERERARRAAEDAVLRDREARERDDRD